MSTCIKISGVPNQIRMNKLAKYISSILCIDSSDFHLRTVRTNKLIMDVILTLPSKFFMQLALERLDNYVFNYANNTYVFSTSIPKKNKKKPAQQQPQHIEPPQEQYNIYKDVNQDRFRSPHCGDSSRLDIQIEILRKQRMILEQEMKLLEEQKKLEMLKTQKESSPSWNHDNNYESIEQPSVSHAKCKQPVEIPNYFNASRVLIGRMNALIRKHSPLHKRKLLTNLLRSTLKQRLISVAVVNGQRVYKTSKVLELYRATYPQDDDENLVKHVLENINESNSFGDDEFVTPPVETDEAFAEETAVSDNTDEPKKEVQSDDVNSIRFVPKKMNYYQSSALLIRHMYHYIKMYSEEHERKKLLDFVYAEIRQRLSEVNADASIFQTSKIIKMYREKYSELDDEDFIKEMANVMRADQSENYASIEALNEKANVADIEQGKTLIGDNNSGFKRKLLKFHQASCVLIKKLNVYVNIYCSHLKRRELLKLLRATLKTRLADVVGNQNIYQTKKVVILYRKKYPESEDEDFIKNLVKNMNCDGPLEIKQKPVDDSDDNKTTDTITIAESDKNIQEPGTEETSKSGFQPNKISNDLTKDDPENTEKTDTEENKASHSISNEPITIEIKIDFEYDKPDANDSSDSNVMSKTSPETSHDDTNSKNEVAKDLNEPSHDNNNTNMSKEPVNTSNDINIDVTSKEPIENDSNDFKNDVISEERVEPNSNTGDVCKEQASIDSNVTSKDDTTEEMNRGVKRKNNEDHHTETKIAQKLKLCDI